MLAELRIRGLGVIAAAELPLHPGLTVVTGETGAGKTMVVHSLGLLLGGRADSGLVRTGESRAVVEGRLAGLAAEPLERSVGAGAELDDGELIVGRSVGADGGRSRAWLGGVGVPATTLGEVVGAAIVLHGQHDQQRLARPAQQRSALDRFAGGPVTAVLADYQRTYDAWRAAVAEAAELSARAQARAEEAELLRAGLARVAAVDPQPAEDEELRARADRLRNAADLQAAAEHARELLAGDGGGRDGEGDIGLLASGARRTLEAAAVHDAELASYAARAAEIGLLAVDLAGDLASYAAGIESDPQALAGVEDRRAELTALTRLHGPDVNALLAWAGQATVRLTELDGSQDRGAELAAEVQQLDDQLTTLAASLSKARRAAAGRLADAIAGELAGLAMPQSRIEITVVPGTRGRHGSDDVEFLLVPHAGAPARALAKGASGGELSRVMLALEVVLAGVGDAATLVFDEVDAGVGGRAAVEVGRRLARLARTHQVICVTHLPQVACFADAHLRVTKSVDGSVTVTGVAQLSATERVVELSRMLGGLDDSDLARGHARELLDLAAAERDQMPAEVPGRPAAPRRRRAPAAA